MLLNFFHPNNNGDIIVQFTINDNIRFPINTTALIYNSDIMGTKAVKLIYGLRKFMHHLEILYSQIEGGLKDEVNKQVLPLKNKAEELISSIDSVMTVVTTVLGQRC